MLQNLLSPGWAAKDAAVYEVPPGFAAPSEGVNVLALEIFEYPEEDILGIPEMLEESIGETESLCTDQDELLFPPWLATEFVRCILRVSFFYVLHYARSEGLGHVAQLLAEESRNLPPADWNVNSVIAEKIEAVGAVPEQTMVGLNSQEFTAKNWKNPDHVDPEEPLFNRPGAPCAREQAAASKGEASSCSSNRKAKKRIQSFERRSALRTRRSAEGTRTTSGLLSFVHQALLRHGKMLPSARACTLDSC